MLVQDKKSEEDAVVGPASKLERGWGRLRPHLEDLPLRMSGADPDGAFHLQWLPDRLAPSIRRLDPDVVHLHWVCNGFLQVETLASIQRPIVWTLHDMWPMTGGCHYSGSCQRYQTRCGACPKLDSQSESDLSRLTWLRKQRAWHDLDLTVVTPSRWLAKCARSSSLLGSFPVKVIMNGQNLNVFKPIDRTAARHIFNLPTDCPLILFGAVNATQDTRKGFDLLLESLTALQDHSLDPSPELVVFGNTASSSMPPTRFNTHYLGRFADEEALAALYSAVDVFVAPSREDNLPMSVQEALACGTPVTAFDVGGMPDLIQHRANGYLATPFDIEDLANGIQWTIADEDRRRDLSRAARETARTTFSTEAKSDEYARLYRTVC